MIWAAILGFAALITLWWVLFGFGGSSNSNTPRAAATPAPTPRAGTQPQQQTVSPDVANLALFTPIDYQPSSYSAPEARRNIFAYYVPPVKPAPIAQEQVPSPTPPPPLLLASLS